MSYQLGYGLMTLVSPFEENPVSVITEFIFLIAITLFFVLDIHIGFLWGIKKSFEIVPPFSFALSENQSEFLLQKLRESFYVSLQIAFPVILAMFIIEISIAIISRTIPQFNIFVVGFPLRIAIGILILTFTFDRIGFLIGEFMKKFIESFSDIILLGVKH
jgi:flagellar biosynthetic protein FliR